MGPGASVLQAGKRSAPMTITKDRTQLVIKETQTHLEELKKGEFSPSLEAKNDLSRGDLRDVS